MVVPLGITRAQPLNVLLLLPPSLHVLLFLQLVCLALAFELLLYRILVALHLARRGFPCHHHLVGRPKNRSATPTLIWPHLGFQFGVQNTHHAVQELDVAYLGELQMDAQLGLVVQKGEDAVHARFAQVFWLLLHSGPDLAQEVAGRGSKVVQFDGDAGVVVVLVVDVVLHVEEPLKGAHVDLHRVVPFAEINLEIKKYRKYQLDYLIISSLMWWF